jgi:hypothetical protein
MDKLSIISGTLFMLAGLFAVTSLAMPEWIVTEVRRSVPYISSSKNFKPTLASEFRPLIVFYGFMTKWPRFLEKEVPRHG